MVVALAGSAAKLGKGSGASVHLAEEGRMECTRCFRVYEMGFMHLVVRRIMYVCFPVIIINHKLPNLTDLGLRNFMIHFEICYQVSRSD